MARHEVFVELLEEDEIPVRRQVAEKMPGRPYSPRFENCKHHAALAQRGAHRRHNKRSYL